MNQPNKNYGPESATPETLSQVIKGAETLLRYSGVEKSSDGTETDMISVDLPIEAPSLVRAKAGTTPTIRITKPVGELARSSRWSYEISYGMEDTHLSRHILVMNDEIPAAEISGYGGRSTDAPLSEAEAQLIAQDLAKIAT